MNINPLTPSLGQVSSRRDLLQRPVRRGTRRGDRLSPLRAHLPLHWTDRPARHPSVELATTTHAGPHIDINRSYGALATYVAHHALSIDGPIREYYLVDRHTTTDPSQWRTQIGWPIFHTALPS